LFTEAEKTFLAAMVLVQVPPGATPGQTIQFQNAGQTMTTTIPARGGVACGPSSARAEESLIRGLLDERRAADRRRRVHFLFLRRRASRKAILSRSPWLRPCPR